MQTKIIRRYYLIPVRMAIIKKKKKQQIINIEVIVEKKGTLVHCWWECKLVNGKQYGGSSKN